MRVLLLLDHRQLWALSRVVRAGPLLGLVAVAEVVRTAASIP